MPEVVDRILRVEIDDGNASVRVIEQNRRGAHFNPESRNCHHFVASGGFELYSAGEPEISIGCMYVRGEAYESDLIWASFPGSRGQWREFKRQLLLALLEYNTEGGVTVTERT